MLNDRPLDPDRAASGSAVVKSEPATSSCRRFSLFDAMILIAGSAIVLSAGASYLKFFAEYSVQLGRAVLTHLPELREGWFRFWTEIREPLTQVVTYGFQFAGAVVFGMTPISRKLCYSNAISHIVLLNQANDLFTMPNHRAAQALTRAAPRYADHRSIPTRSAAELSRPIAPSPRCH